MYSFFTLTSFSTRFHTPGELTFGELELELDARDVRGIVVDPLLVLGIGESVDVFDGDLVSQPCRICSGSVRRFLRRRRIVVTSLPVCC